MTKKTYKELKKQVETLQVQNRMLEEELQRIRLRMIQSSDSNDFDSNSINLEQKFSKKKYNSHNDESDDSSNYSSLADLNADMSQKISDIQRQLSAALLENAKLKKSISYVEAENANLIAENHELKWKVESLSKDSDILSEKDSELDSLKDQLKKAKSEASQISQMLKENSIFKQEVASYHQKLSKHKEELKRAKQEIERLTAKNNESDFQIAQMEKSLNRNKEETLKLYRQNQKLMADFERRQINQLKIGAIPDQSNSSSISSNSNSVNEYESINKQFDYSDCQRKLYHDLNEIKAFCTSLRDENFSLKNEVRHLREKLRVARSFYLRDINMNQRQNSYDYDEDNMPKQENVRSINRNYHIKNYNNQKSEINNSDKNNFTQNNNNSNQQTNQSRPKEFILDEVSKSIISRQMSNFLIKIELLNSKVMTKLDHLFLKWNTFETSLRQACSYRHEKIQFRSLTSNNSNEQFLSSLNREIRIIDTLTRCFAKSHNIPSHAIPNPRQLIGDSEALSHFLDHKEHHHRSRKGRR